jgi:3-methyladenine DNA glycosylase Tag
MFKKFWDKLCNLFNDSNLKDIAEIRITATNRYHKIFSVINNANSLAKLLSVRKEIRSFQQYLIENHEEYWGRNLIIGLNKFWVSRYEYWKRKTRGN